MKKKYQSPEAEIEKFTIDNVLTTSTNGSGWEDGDEIIEF